MGHSFGRRTDGPSSSTTKQAARIDKVAPRIANKRTRRAPLDRPSPDQRTSLKHLVSAGPGATGHLCASPHIAKEREKPTFCFPSPGGTAYKRSVVAGPSTKGLLQFVIRCHTRKKP